MPRALSPSDQRKYAIELAKLGPAPDPLNWTVEEIMTFYEQWADALESGKYKQSKFKWLRWGFEGHKDFEGYSTLGVLCDIFPVGDWDVAPNEAPRNKCVQYKVHYSVNSSDIIGYVWDNLKDGPLSVGFIYASVDSVAGGYESFKDVARDIRRIVARERQNIEHRKEVAAKKALEAERKAEKKRDLATQLTKTGKRVRTPPREYIEVEVTAKDGTKRMKRQIVLDEYGL